MFNLGSDKRIAITQNKEFHYFDIISIKNKFSELIPPRSLVFLLCSNTIGSLAGYVSFIENKTVPVMLDATMDQQMFGDLVCSYEPKFFWCPIEFIDKINRDTQCLMEYEGYVLLENTNAKIFDLNKELALLLTTSGSTGSPKLVRLSYKNLESNARSIATYLDLNDEERPITSLPMHYSYGLSIINSHLLVGATILLTDRSIVEKEFWSFFNQYKATSLSGVPYTYQILKQFRMLRRDMPSLKTLTQAGGKLSEDMVLEIADWAKATGRKFFVMYGQTEATARMSYLPFDKTIEKSASIGFAIPGGQFSIRDAYNNKISLPNIPGELFYEGDNVSMGYAESLNDLLKEDENKGVLRTGDIAQVDEDGFYYIVGRLKRFIKVFGNRVNLDQVEQLVKHITSDCACTGFDDKLIIYIINGSIQDQVKTYIASKTGLHSSAVEVKVINEIPKNSSGKVQYAQL